MAPGIATSRVRPDRDDPAPRCISRMSAPGIVEALYRDLPAALEVHLHQIDLLQDTVLLARLTRTDFAQASFLDQRVLSRETAADWVPWGALAQRLSDQARTSPAHYLFHIGHCGSTLLSRLLAELGVLPLREPLTLRTLAELHPDLDAAHSRWSRATFDARLALVLAAYDRGAGPRAVQPTSWCNDLAPAILADDARTRATVCFVRPRAHIANLLVGPASRLDLMSMAPMRLRRLDVRVGGGTGRLAEMSPGVVAAMSWAAEMASLAAALEDVEPERLCCIDFDVFLEDTGKGLRRLAEHTGAGTIEHARLDAVASGPATRQYSKAPEHAFDTGLRRRLLEQSQALFGEEIRAGLDWLERTAGRFVPVARALERFGGGASRGVD